MSKKVISIVLCLALVVAMAVPAFATSTTLYTRTNSGYRITGTASITGGKSSSTMTAAEQAGAAVRPIEDYDASIWMRSYAAGDTYLGYTDTYGYPTLYVSYSYNKGNIAYIKTEHTFNGTSFGTRTVYA